MKTFDLIAMCLRNLSRRKFRTFLTVVGVVIGTCSIVLMFSVGIGLRVSQEEYLSSIGDLTVIEVYNYRGGGDVLLDDAAVASFQALPNVVAVSPLMQLNLESGNWEVTAGRNDRWGSWISLYGVNPEALEVLGYELAEGEFFQPGDGREIQMVFGPMSAYYFYNSKNWDSIDWWPDENGNIPDPYFDVTEEEINLKVTYWGGENEKVQRYEVNVVGITDAGENDWEKRFSVYMHIEDMKAIKAQYEKENSIKKDKNDIEQYDNIKIKVDDIKNVAAVQQAIKDMGYSPSSLEDWRQQLEESAQQIQSFLVILGAVSLFVAAISITNTMIMSVYERTREIGVMKVLGCLVSNIRVMFLVEAGLIGFLGGCVGIGMSYLLSYLLNTFGSSLGQVLSDFAVMEGSRVSIIEPWLVLVGLACATAIGLVSGFQPANRAVKISALEAIKTE